MEKQKFESLKNNIQLQPFLHFGDFNINCTIKYPNKVSNKFQIEMLIHATSLVGIIKTIFLSSAFNLGGFSKFGDFTLLSLLGESVGVAF